MNEVDLLAIAWSMDIFFFFPSLSVFVLFIFDTSENKKKIIENNNKVGKNLEGITLRLENCLISVKLSCEWCVGRSSAWNCVRE